MLRTLGKGAALAFAAMVAITGVALAIIDDGSLVGNSSHENDIAIVSGTPGSGPTIKPGGPSSDANVNINVQGAGTGIVALGQPICTITGVTPQTCNGQRGIVTTGTLTTAGVTSASFTINNSSVSATSMIQCTINSYSGTISTNGVPMITQCVPGAGSFVVNIYNAHATNALNGAVGIGFVILHR